MISSLEKLRRLAALAGWAALLTIMFSTLSPIEARPHIPMLGADIERFLAYFAAGATFSFAYPRQRWLILAGIVALAIGLEWLQTLEETRHGMPHDAIVKIAGATLGSVASAAFDTMALRLRKPA
ncbi:VanZ family protein [uncultured Bosea sp.]|uniref:VanZ family protein n=1 Tax=uncultured Bosea sp. TaxID=211457 RepID=UPI0025D434E2|nr:VanZ family protein [uncultured Bosea sp.]